MEKNLEKFKKLIDFIDIIDWKGKRYILLFNSDNLKTIKLEGLDANQRFALANIVIDIGHGIVVKNKFCPTVGELA